MWAKWLSSTRRPDVKRSPMRRHTYTRPPVVVTPITDCRGVVRRVADTVVVMPKDVKAKPGKGAPTAEEAKWMDAIVRYGCIACVLDGQQPRPTAVHHILRGGRRIGHLFTIGLCDPGHHQQGASLGLVSRHPWKARFEAKYGAELELLAMLKAKLGFFDQYEVKV